ncbi:MAG: superoxide dismutase [Acutalibacteraceae bacterium]
MENNCYEFKNLPLEYSYDALEPFIDERTMYLHHDKHLGAYIDKLNAVLKNQPQLKKLNLKQLIQIAPKLPDGLQQEIRNNAGGVFNHRFFFSLLTDKPKEQACGRLIGQINCQFGSFEKFKDKFTAAALSVFGSGYAWLVFDGCSLRIVKTANQNCPVEQHLCPIFNIDVWEHAYYLKNYNVRADYIENWFQVLDWDKAERNFLACFFK